MFLFASHQFAWSGTTVDMDWIVHIENKTVKHLGYLLLSLYLRILEEAGERKLLK